MDWGAALEAVRPWLTTGAIVGILGIIAKLYIDNRRLRLAETERSQEFQLEISADGRSNLQFVIDNLVRDIASQREAAAAQAAAHDRCQHELTALRGDYTEQGRKLDGVVRQFLQFQLSGASALPPGERTPMLAELRRQFDDLAAQDSSATPPA